MVKVVKPKMQSAFFFRDLNLILSTASTQQGQFMKQERFGFAALIITILTTLIMCSPEPHADAPPPALQILPESEAKNEEYFNLNDNPEFVRADSLLLNLSTRKAGIDLLNKMAEHFQQKNDWKAYIFILNRLGYVYSKQGKFASAKDFAFKAIHVAEEHLQEFNDYLLSDSYYVLGKYYDRILADDSTAITFFKRRIEPLDKEKS